MVNCLSRKEQLRRKNIAEGAKKTIKNALEVESEDETCLMLEHNDFYLQIAFSPLHPLMVFYLARAVNRNSTSKDMRFINEMNLKSVLGSHSLNDDVGCYSYRAAHWLDTELTAPRFIEILGRCTEEAQRVYSQLAKA